MREAEKHKKTRYGETRKLVLERLFPQIGSHRGKKVKTIDINITFEKNK